MEVWKVKSNAKSGNGYSDISIEFEDEEIGIIIKLNSHVRPDTTINETVQATGY